MRRKIATTYVIKDTPIGFKNYFLFGKNKIKMNTSSLYFMGNGSGLSMIADVARMQEFVIQYMGTYFIHGATIITP